MKKQTFFIVIKTIITILFGGFIYLQFSGKIPNGLAKDLLLLFSLPITFFILSLFTNLFGKKFKNIIKENMDFYGHPLDHSANDLATLKVVFLILFYFIVLLFWTSLSIYNLYVIGSEEWCSFFILITSSLFSIGIGKTIGKSINEFFQIKPPS